MRPPAISVIIPTYNSAPLVVEAVESVLAQTRPAAEVIIVDDGSTDDTAERIARFSGRVRYIRQANARVAAARNTGVRAATGDAIAFLDADDIWHPRKLELQTAALAARPDLGLLATQVFPWPGALPDAEGRSDVVSVFRTIDMLPVNPLLTSSVLVQKSVLNKAGEFDGELFGPEDYDLWLHCSQLTGVGRLECLLTGYRDTPASVGKQGETMYRGLTRIHEKLAASGIWRGQARFRRKCRAHVEFTTAHMYLAGGRTGRAAQMVLRSLARYPFPFERSEVRMRFARPRLLKTTLLRLVGVARALNNPGGKQ